jgi:molybdopterin-guanine dinucleotide biosynthesis protein
MADIFDLYVHPKTEVKPIIYAYSDTRFPGCLKVGYTDRTVEERMHEHYPTLTPGQSYKVEYVESALNAEGAIFTDHDVHRVLEIGGIRAIRTKHGKKSEWYKCSVNDVKAAILAVKTSSVNFENRTQNFNMRPEQQRAVNMTKTYFEEETKERPGHTAKFLWNAKMRFGKTFTAYELAKAMRMKRVLILTFKPAVEESWESDLMTHMDFEGWQFYSRELSIKDGLRPEDLDQSRPIVCFGSFQDFLGTNASGGIKTKNEWVHATNWDMVIFDEYHFGAWRENAKKLFEKEDEDSYDDLDLDKYKREEADNVINEDFLPITTKYYLFLSGTPFRALNTGEFMEDQIFSWTYSDEQEAKEKWNDGDGPNPYAAMPQIVLMTYRIPDEIRKIAYNEDFNEFDLNVFFAAKPKVKNHPDTSEFIYKDYVQKWLSLIRGAYMPSSVDDLKLGQDAKPVMPYSDARMLSVLNHTLWFLPNVASCYAMANLLAEKQNVFYHDYHVNVCAGTAAGVGLAALGPVRDSMNPPLETKTITLSCGKLTTGVTIKPWTGIFMLRNLSSPETYFQAAFRVQSPWTIKKEDGTEEIMKENCYIFDFALDRALRQISDYSCRLNIKESNPEKKVESFIHFLPVLAFDGSTMTAVSASDILDITMAGTSATLLARRWESALLVNVDNETLQRLLDNEDAMKAIMNIEGFRSLNKDIETIINKSNAVKKVKAEKGDKLTPKEKKELTQEEKEYKSKRKEIQEKLIKFATRIPIFMYLTDFREYSLKDVITQFESGLFKKVTGLTVEDFELLVSLGIFNDSLMNSAVYNFKRYEDASLEYTGISKHATDENIGLFSTVISKDEYREMASAQNASMQENPFKKTVILEKPKPNFTPLKTTYQRQETLAIKVADGGGDTYKVDKPKVKEIDLSKFRVGTIVEHKRYGVGKVTGIKKGKVMVSFDGANKTFLFPKAIEDGFLTVKEW